MTKENKPQQKNKKYPYMKVEDLLKYFHVTINKVSLQ